MGKETHRISKELKDLVKKANFPIQVLPLVKVSSAEEAVHFAKSPDYDVPIIYAASGDGNMLESCVTEKRNNIIFLRHRSGPIYLWYEIVNNRFLRKGDKEFELDTYRNPAGMDIHDVVVDDYGELLYKLKALYDICRSQYDIKIEGDWKKLLQDHRGFHWMMACGDYIREMEYACRKIDINWKTISE